MLKYFKKELFAKERCASLVNEKPYNPNNRNENTMTVFLSGQQKVCWVYCQGEHFPTKCDKVIDINARKEILKNSSFYYLCLKTGHVSKKCTKNYICRICSKKHHISICEERNKQSPYQIPRIEVNLNHKKGSENVLLQSAVLHIENIANSNYCTDVTVLFNTVIQRLFVTESVRKRLKIPTLRKETMIFQVFGQNDNKVKEVDIVKIKIKGNKRLNFY